MKLSTFDIRELLFVAIAVFVGFTMHEAAHAYVAFQFGDDTAFQRGRLTINPIKHIDPVGTVLLPLVLLAIHAPFVFGWAKPVPIQASKLRNPNRDMALVAAAGPCANLLLAALFGIVAFALQKNGIPSDSWLAQSINICGVTNISLGVLNLIPIPPLDGSKVVAGLLPGRWRMSYLRLAKRGYALPLILIAILVLAVVSARIIVSLL